MPEEKNFTLFSPGSLQTFIAANFIIALLALGMTIYNFTRTTQAVSNLLDLQLLAATVDDINEADVVDPATIDDLSARIVTLEEELKTLKTAPAAPAAPPAE